MQELHLVGFTKDHRSLIFSARKGAKSGSYVVPVDDDLLAAIDEAATHDLDEPEVDVETDPAPLPPRPQSQLSVRQVQVRLRAGESVEDIAADAGVEPGWVERFSPPVRAEQRRVIDRALVAHLERPRAGHSAAPLRRAIASAMADRGVGFTEDDFESAWSARLVEGSHWQVGFTFPMRGRSRTLWWDFDLRDDALTTEDRFATQLSFVADLDDLPAAESVVGARSRSAGGLRRPGQGSSGGLARPGSSRPAGLNGTTASPPVASRRLPSGSTSSAPPTRPSAPIPPERTAEPPSLRAPRPAPPAPSSFTSREPAPVSRTAAPEPAPPRRIAPVDDRATVRGPNGPAERPATRPAPRPRPAPASAPRRPESRPGASGPAGPRPAGPQRRNERPAADAHQPRRAPAASADAVRFFRVDDDTTNDEPTRSLDDDAWGDDVESTPEHAPVDEAVTAADAHDASLADEDEAPAVADPLDEVEDDAAGADAAPAPSPTHDLRLERSSRGVAENDSYEGVRILSDVPVRSVGLADRDVDAAPVSPRRQAAPMAPVERPNVRAHTGDEGDVQLPITDAANDRGGSDHDGGPALRVTDEAPPTAVSGSPDDEPTSGVRFRGSTAAGDLAASSRRDQDDEPDEPAGDTGPATGADTADDVADAVQADEDDDEADGSAVDAVTSTTVAETPESPSPIRARPRRRRRLRAPATPEPDADADPVDRDDADDADGSAPDEPISRSAATDGPTDESSPGADPPPAASPSNRPRRRRSEPLRAR